MNKSREYKYIRDLFQLDWTRLGPGQLGCRIAKSKSSGPLF